MIRYPHPTQIFLIGFRQFTWPGRTGLGHVPPEATLLLHISLSLAIPASPISQYLPDRSIFAKFPELVEPWLLMINLKLVFRSIQGRCRGKWGLWMFRSHALSFPGTKRPHSERSFPGTKVWTFRSRNETAYSDFRALEWTEWRERVTICNKLKMIFADRKRLQHLLFLRIF